MKNLVIVESPAKAKTLKKYLGEDFTVEASKGHVKDLPQRRLGVDIDNDFKPQFEILKDRKELLNKLRSKAKSAQAIYMASDPDREGEAIAWHLAEELKQRDKTFRAVFNEITPAAVRRAIASPQRLNRNLFEAQLARRILDRLVGYQISPVLWRKVQRGLSAGRVQSVAVKLIYERERAIQNFQPEEYWNLFVEVEAARPPRFRLKFQKKNGQSLVPHTQAEADAILEAVRGRPLTVKSVEVKTVRRHPAAPFITSTLQQEAARKLGFTTKKTMDVAQRLYEGIELGERGAVGLITYMRTDSVRIGDEALARVREHIAQTWGPDYLPPEPRRYKTKKGAQDAHEAIRPTMMDLPPAVVAPFLKKDEHRLYSLVWNRFVASQMVEASFEQTSVRAVVEAGADQFEFGVSGRVLKFDGFLAVYEESRDDDAGGSKPEDSAIGGEGDGAEGSANLPPLAEGDVLKPLDYQPEQKFTQPPPRYTEASLVKELEQKGIGRPSTYATIVSTIQSKKYVQKEKGRFHLTELGRIVTELLSDHFPEIMDPRFTAMMEDELDKVEEGKSDWVDTLRNFYNLFKKRLEDSVENMRNIRNEKTPTEIICDKCGRRMVIRWGRKGQFLACSGYPDCRNAKEFTKAEDGTIKVLEHKKTDYQCDKCGRPMIVKTGRKGRFLACSGYPECKNSMPLRMGIRCAEDGCDGELIERQSRRGKTFYACSRYPDCNYVSWHLPVDFKCPGCGFHFMTFNRNGALKALKCPKCGHTEEVPEETLEELMP
ncbi:MAG: type I DNA topoisomerase [Candidatus Sumerlaeia bacterium]